VNESISFHACHEGENESIPIYLGEGSNSSSNSVKVNMTFENAAVGEMNREFKLSDFAQRQRRREGDHLGDQFRRSEELVSTTYLMILKTFLVVYLHT
jgi:hypothetical protein